MGMYKIADRKDSRRLAEFLASEGQLLMPMVELAEQAELAIDDVIEVMGRATVEALLKMSAEAVAALALAGRRGHPTLAGEAALYSPASQRKLLTPSVDRRDEATVPQFSPVPRFHRVTDSE